MTWSGLTIFDIGVGLDITGGDGAGASDIDEELHRLAFMRDEEDLLQVEDDVGDILHDPVDALKLVVDSVDLDRRDGRALDRAEKHAPEGVADGMSVAGFKRFGDKLGIGIGCALLDFDEAVRQFEFSNTFWHGDGVWWRNELVSSAPGRWIERYAVSSGCRTQRSTVR